MLIDIIFTFRNLLYRKLLTRLTIPTVISAVMLVVLIFDLYYTSIPVIPFAWILSVSL